jgi:hypothetical protein
MQWRQGVGITLEEFQQAFFAVFGPQRGEEDLVDRMENLNISSTSAADHGEQQLSTADTHLSQLRSLRLPVETPPATVVVYTPPTPRRRSHDGQSRVIGTTLPTLPSFDSPDGPESFDGAVP